MGRIAHTWSAHTPPQEEGPRGLYRGLSPALVRHVPYTGSRILIYEQLRRCFTPAGAAHPSLTTKVAMGATAGALGQLLAVPAGIQRTPLAPLPRTRFSAKDAPLLNSAFLLLRRTENHIRLGTQIWSRFECRRTAAWSRRGPPHDTPACVM